MEEKLFCEKVGMLMEDDLGLLQSLGFGSDAIQGDGMFDTERIGDLIQFCNTHPEYHIVTVVDANGTTVYLNKAVFVNRMGYYLANGDKGESLFADIPRFTAEQKRVAREAKEYLDTHGLCLSWDFCKEHPPTPKVQAFLLHLGGYAFDLRDAADDVVRYAIEVIEDEWGLNEEDDEEEVCPC